MEIRPLSARSVVLSLLLAAHPPELSARDLVAVGEHFGISESTLRVALTRMVAAGDLDRSEGSYRIGPRMLERQRRQDAALDLGSGTWDGTWEQLVVTAGGRSAADRADLRTTLADLKLAELREGVWMRPANLARALPDWPSDLITVFRVRVDDPVLLARRLWDLDAWNLAGFRLLDGIGTARTPAEQLTMAAAVVRHLRTDPALPAELLPDGWVAPDLRAAYSAYQAELLAAGMPLEVGSPG